MSGEFTVQALRVYAQALTSIEEPFADGVLWAADEIERLQAKNHDLLRVMQTVYEEGHTDCVADDDGGAQRCDAICTEVWQMCAGCQLRVTIALEATP